MNNELMRQVRGEVRTTRQDRATVERARSIHQEVQEIGLMIDGALALAGHVAKGECDLIDYGRYLSAGDAEKMAAVARAKQCGFETVESLQRGLYDRWGL